MRRASIHYIVDGLLLLDMLGLAFIGVLLGFVIPSGGGPHGEKYLWGLHRHQWGNIHMVLSIALLALVVLHLVLHWNWIRCMTRELFGRRSRESTGTSKPC